MFNDIIKYILFKDMFKIMFKDIIKYILFKDIFKIMSKDIKYILF